jgi:hypothetical protein
MQNSLQDAIHQDNADARDLLIGILANSEHAALTKAAEKMAWCGCAMEIVADPDTGIAQTWTSRCKNPLCPTCAQKRAAQLRDQLNVAVATMKDPRTIILTLKSCDTDIGRQLADLRNYFNRLRRTPLWKRSVRGGVATIEVTLNAKTQAYHPHIHLIYDGAFIPVELLRKEWHTITNDSWIIWITQVADRKNAVAELCKYISKPARLTAWAPDKIISYALGTKGRRFFSTFGTLYRVNLNTADENPKPGPGKLSYSIFRLVKLAAFGHHDPQRAIFLIAQRWPRLAPWLFHHFPELEPHETKVRRQARTLAKILGQPAPSPLEELAQLTKTEIEAELCQVFRRIADHDAAADYEATETHQEPYQEPIPA